MRYPLCKFLFFWAAACFAWLPAQAQEREVPYWASLADDEVFMRVGPSTAFHIDWVYRRDGLPVKVIRTNQGWRYVEDPDGVRGWIFNQLLTAQRSAIVVGEGVIEMRELPNEASPVLWRAEIGVVGQLGECEQGWCEFDVAGRSGWVVEDRLWGTGAP